MVPEIPHLWCELYKLNIYGAPGGHFRHTLTHHDLSRCLVVLWSALHHQQEVKFDWTVVGFCSTGTPGTSNLIMYRHLYLGVENCNVPAHMSAKHNPSLDAYLVKANYVVCYKPLQVPVTHKIIETTLHTIRNKSLELQLCKGKKTMNIL